MKKVRNYRVLRPTAWTVAALMLAWCAPPARAFHKRQLPNGWKTQVPNPELREKIRARETAAEKLPEVRELSDKELDGICGAGKYRNPYFNGVMPWQRAFRDVNTSNGNLFKSFTDIQVSPARGAGLAFQRTYNSNDSRVGPFGIGWSHAYDIRMEESADVENSSGYNDPVTDKANLSTRTDFFGGKHRYHRDADGLYTPPPYLFDELDSGYDAFLVNGPPVSLEDTQKGMDGTVKHFTKIGNQRVCDTITDRHGNQTTLSYTTVTVGGVAQPQITSVTDPSGRALSITWSNLGSSMAPAYRITQVAGPYDSSTMANLYTVTYEYNSDYNLWKVHQDPSGLNRTTTYTYTSYAGSMDTEYGLLASISDPLSHTVSYTYGMPTDDFTNTVWVTSVTEPVSGGTNTWTFSPGYGSSSYPVVCGISDGTLGVTVALDSQLRQCFYGIYGGYYLWYKNYQAYDDSNNVVLQAGPGGYAPDLSGGYTDAVWAGTTVMTYGPHGNVLTSAYSTSSGNLSTTTTTYYDASKYFQKATVTDANGGVTSFDYYDDSASAGRKGELKWVRDPRYSTTSAQFDYDYNSYGQKSSESNLKGVVTNYTYGDTWGNLTETVQDPGTGHLNRTTDVSYDVAGRVVSSTDPKSQTSTFTYNGVGQPYQASLPGETVTYAYGTNGRTASVTDGRGTTYFNYESGNDRVSSVVDPVTGTVSYTYGTYGERATMTLPGSVTWTYTYWNPSSSGWKVMPKDDPNSLAPMLKRITDQDGRVVDYALDLAGEVREVRSNQTFDSGGALTSYQKCRYLFDGDFSGTPVMHRLYQVKNTWNAKDSMGNWTSSLLVQNDYTYDDNLNRATNIITSPGPSSRTESYGYDALNRLTSVNYGDGETQSYAFDPMGNRTSKSVTTSGTVTESYTYNNANMLLTRGSNSYTNDLNGNTTAGGGRSNTWDGQNRLTQCVYSGTTTSFTYGSNGLRRRSVTGSNTTDYVLDGDSAVKTLLNSSADHLYLHGPRGPEYDKSGSSSPLWYLYDGLGSVLGTVDSSGTIQQTRKFDVYGALRASSGGSGTRHKLVGALGHPSDDDTGLVYMRARYMDPTVGRFLSEDPAKDGTNWFAYCGSNSTNYVDFTGKFFDLCGIFIAGILILGGAHVKDKMDLDKLGWALIGAGVIVMAVEAALMFMHLRDAIIENILPMIQNQRRATGYGSTWIRIGACIAEEAVWACIATDA